MNLLMDFTIVKPNYEETKFRYFKGVTGGPQDVVDPPDDTGLEFFQSTDGDVLVFSVMYNGEPYALACVVTTDFATGRSTGRYFVCKPTISGNNITWTLVTTGADGIRLVIPGSEDVQEVAGNPHGVGQAGDNLVIVDYDDDGEDEDGNTSITNIYTLGIADLVGAASGNLTVTAATINPTKLPQQPSLEAGEVFKVHGNGLTILTDNSNKNNPVTNIFAQFNGVVEDATSHTPKRYVNGTVVKLSSGATPVVLDSVTVGKNAMGMVPLPIPAAPPAPSGTTAGLAIAVPCLGGLYKEGETNGTDSCLYRIENIFSVDPDNHMTAAIAITGDSVTTLTEEGTRDIKSVTFSEDGLFGYVLTLAYTSDDIAYWKIYQTTAANILGASGLTISEAVNKNLLVFLEGSITGNGSDWEVLYENAATPVNGRLWFVQGSTIRVSQGSLYSVSHEFVKLYDDTDPIKVGYINSADLIREMIFQWERGHSIETRLIKGKTVAMIARAVAAAAAPAEEEEK
jgi:hypothetical protein